MSRCAHSDSRLSQARTQNCARAHSSAERSTANPEVQPARNSARTPEGRKYSSGFDSEMLTRLCGAGAPFRPLFCPNPSFYVPGPKIFLPTTRPLTRSPQHRGRNTPDKQRSIRKTTYSVKSHSTQYGGKVQEKPRFGPNPAHPAHSYFGIVAQIVFERLQARERAAPCRDCRGR